MTPAEMKAQNTHFGILKMITGNDDFYIAGNGAIRKKEPQHNRYQAQPSHNHHQERHQQHHAHPQAQGKQQQGVPMPQSQHFPPPQAFPAQSFSHPPPQHSQRPLQQGYPTLPQFIAPTLSAPPPPPIIRTTPISEADLLGEFDFSSAEPRPSSAGSDLPRSAFVQPQHSASKYTTQSHENSTYQ